MTAFWWLCGAVMVVSGVLTAVAFRDYVEGGLYAAIGVAFVFAHHYRLRRDKDRARKTLLQTFD